MAVGDLVIEDPMTTEANQHCDVEDFVPLDHPCDEHRPMQSFQDAANGVGQPTPDDWLDETKTVTPPQRDAGIQPQPAHAEV